MPPPPPPGHLEFSFSNAPRRRPGAVDPADAWTIVVAADMSGRAAHGIHETITGRRVVPVNIDTLETVLADFGASLELPFPDAPGGRVALPVRSLDDLHPDALLNRIPPLAELVAARQELDSGNAAAGAARLQALLQVPTAETPAPASPASAAPPVSESNLDTLARLLGVAPTARPEPAKPAGLDAEALIRGIVSGSSSAAAPAPAGAAGLAAAADLEIATRLRDVLRAPAFVALERAWRSVDFLIRQSPDDEHVRFVILDATPAELAADRAGLERTLRDADARLLVLDDTFGADLGDLARLASLLALAATGGFLVVAGAAPTLAGCDSLAAHPDPDDWTAAMTPEVAAAWAALRQSPGAARAALVLPRFLLRQPYGAEGEPIESLAFEELSSPADHESFLWGNSAFLCARALADAAAAGEAPGSLHGAAEVEDLIQAHFTEHGGAAIKPPTEAWLADRANDRLSAAGLTVLQGKRHSTSARLILQPLGAPHR